MKRSMICSAALFSALALGACAGRSPNPVQTVRAYDQSLSCDQIIAEIKANNSQISDLASEQGGKIAQNVAAGIAGVFIPVLWFGMDFQDAAGKEERALAQRNEYLATLAHGTCSEEEIAAMPAPTPKPATATESPKQNLDESR